MKLQEIKHNSEAKQLQEKIQQACGDRTQTDKARTDTTQDQYLPGVTSEKLAKNDKVLLEIEIRLPKPYIKMLPQQNSCFL